MHPSPRTSSDDWRVIQINRLYACMKYTVMTPGLVSMTTLDRSGTAILRWWTYILGLTKHAQPMTLIHHLSDMCDIFFATNRQNYQQLVMRYFLNLLNIDVSHPGVREVLRRVLFQWSKPTNLFPKQWITPWSSRSCTQPYWPCCLCANKWSKALVDACTYILLVIMLVMKTSTISQMETNCNITLQRICWL